ncbi:MAG TPA: hypothetical protein GXZ60_12075 [Intrasporangiaceae bacterium]|nr:hypothetical protein [Intrasporangiaceae bacterium]
MEGALRLVPGVVATGMFLVGVGSAASAPRALGQPATALTVVCAAALVLIALVGGRSAGSDRSRWGRRTWERLALLAAATVLVCTVVTVSTSYRYGWDPVTVQQVAEGTREPNSAIRYFSVYPNILPMLMIGKLAVWLERAIGLDYAAFFAVVAVASLAVTLAAGLVWLARRGARPVQAAGFVVLTGLIVGISPWMGVPYTDLVALPIPLLVVALLSFLPGLQSPRWMLLVAGLAVLVGIGWAVKTTPIVLLAAVVVGVLLAPGDRPQWQRWSAGGAVVALAWLTSAGLIAAAKPVSDLPLREGVEVDTSLYVAAGMRTQIYADGRRCYGCFDRRLTRPTYGKDTAAQRAVALPAIRASLHDRTILGHGVFYAHKTHHTWGDGMFFAWGEGLDMEEPLQYRLSPDSFLRSVGTADGHLLGVRTAVVGGLWAGVLILAAVRLWQGRREWDLVAISAAVAGLFAFTTLFQGRGRYILVMAPVLIALACAPAARRSAPRG